MAKQLTSLPRLQKEEELILWARHLVERLQDIFLRDIGNGGGVGPPGPPGPGVPANGTDGQVLTKVGSADYATTWRTPADAVVVAYRHIQTTAATTWTIPHNLSFRPNVTAVDSTGRAIWPGTLDYTSPTSVTLTFSAAVGGEAYLT